METKKSAFIGLALTFAILVSLAAIPVFGDLSPAYAAPSWQQEWDRLAANAQKEGKLVIASSIGTEVRRAYTKAFGEKYRLALEFLPGKPAEIAPKLLAERRAGSGYPVSGVWVRWCP